MVENNDNSLFAIEDDDEKIERQQFIFENHVDEEGALLEQIYSIENERMKKNSNTYVSIGTNRLCLFDV